MELKYDFYINADKEKVWDALVSPDGTRSSFFGSVLKSSFGVGEPFEYVGPGADGDDTVHVYGTVVAFEPQQKLSFVEHPGPAYHSNHAELESRMTFTLDTVGNCTKLTLVNDHFTEGHPAYEKAADAWWMVLSSIKTYAETGKTLDFGW